MAGGAASILAFLVLIAPGAAFELLYQRRRPARSTSAFQEANRVALVSAVSIAAAISAFWAASMRWPDHVVHLPDLLQDSLRFLTERPGLVVANAVGLEALAISVASALALLVTWSGRAHIVDASAWVLSFRDQAPDATCPYVVLSTHEGERHMGYLGSYTSEPVAPAERELQLLPPLFFQGPNDDAPVPYPIDTQRVVIGGREIAAIAVSYIRDDQADARIDGDATYDGENDGEIESGETDRWTNP